jgi:hypothetical protein
LFFAAEVTGLFLWGFIILGITLAIGKLLHIMQREMEKDAEASGGTPGRTRMFFMHFGQRRTWRELWEHLGNKGLVPAGSALPLALFPAANASPWYVRGLLAFGGWVAALIFLAFVVLFLFLTMKIRSNEGRVLLVVSLGVLAAGTVVARGKGLFAQHFGLALAFAGGMGASCGLVMLTDLSTHWPLYVAVFLGLSLAPVRLGAYRFCAAAGAVALMPVGFRGFGLFGYRAFMRREEPLMALQGLEWVWWALVGGAFAFLWLRERHWRGNAALASLVPPLLHGVYAGMAGYGIYMLSVNVVFFSGEGFIPVALDSLGAGCGIALACMAWQLTRDAGAADAGRNASLRLLALGCGVAAIPAGMFLPGVSLALLGLATGRLLTDRVMQGAAGTILFAYMVHYYYALHMSLLRKSLLLMGSGVLLLALAFLWKHLPGAGQAAPGTEDGHA